MEKKPNRLMKEKSPYLLQHAYNPVDWYPWGEAAFAKARQENKPVFLSIGYSTCHWCHVMERESFEDEEVAALLNAHFVPVKVDREERPDVDGIYMSVCQAMTGRGGWPLTVVMTPEQQPFFAGTYFPKQRRWGQPGLMEVLSELQQQWQAQRGAIVEYAAEISRTLTEQAAPSDVKLAETLLDKAYWQLRDSFDVTYGGFSRAPKFPMPHTLMFLLRFWLRSGKEEALLMVEQTLTAMRQGGMYDHIGYGFARYSTDPAWLVPHFEKMLYDNALLCYAYLEGYQCTGKRDFARVAEEILTYVLTDMRDAAGSFYSAEDADSEGVEGKFYVFGRQEVIAALGAVEGEIFADFYQMTPEGNFEDGKNILHFSQRDVETYAIAIGWELDKLEAVLSTGRRKLHELRGQRVRPHLDDKVLTGWNALMIAAFAKAARVLDSQEYIGVAQTALGALEARLVRSDGRLLARYRDGEAAYPAYLDDYAYLLWALLELYETTHKAEYLEKAQHWAGEMERLFWDEQGGAFFFSGKDGERLIARPKEVYDGALPSGNSVAGLMLQRLGALSGDASFEALGVQTLTALAGLVAEQPSAFAYYLMALDWHLTPKRRIVLAGDFGWPETQAMLRVVGRAFLPDALVRLASAAERTGEYPAKDGKATAYVCEAFACLPPVQTAADLAKQIQSMDNNY